LPRLKLLRNKLTKAKLRPHYEVFFVACFASKGRAFVLIKQNYVMITKIAFINARRFH
jgi:hypothetical protein